MLTLLALALAPVVVLLVYIYSRDVIAKEPIGMLLKAFFGGILSAILAIIWYELIHIDLYGDGMLGVFLAIFSKSFFQAGIPEELCKFFILYMLVWKNKEFDEQFDGIIYAVFISMGFAGLENIFYVLNGGKTIAILRAFTAVPGHFFFAVIMGYYFSKAKFVDQGKRSTLVKAVVFPMIVHGCYDFICFSVEAFLGNAEHVGFVIGMTLTFFVFNFFLWRHGIKKIRELRQVDLAIKQDMEYRAGVQQNSLPVNQDDPRNKW